MDDAPVEPTAQPDAPPSDGEVVEPAAPARRQRRTWFQRMVLSLNLLVVVACLTAALALANVHEEVSQISRIAGSGTLATATEELEPLNFLVVGVDNAEGLDAADPVLRGRNQASLLADTIMVARVDPASGRAWLLSIPRDLYVPIAGTGAQDRINSALALGDPTRLIDTVQESLDIPIHHYVQINFSGFVNLVELIGGVPVWFEHPARDVHSGLFVDSAGCVNLEGEQALAFVRSRRAYEVNVDGQWERDGTSDFGRMARQQTFVRAALNRAIARGARNPIEMRRMIEATQGEVVLDDALSISGLVDLGTRFREFDPENLESFTLPVSDAEIGGAAVLMLRESEAQSVLEVFRGGNVFDGLTALVRTEVRNGTGVVGEGRSAAEDLARHGFTIVRTGDAGDWRNERTHILYRPDGLLGAVVLARFLPGDVEIIEDDTVGTDDDTLVVLVTGDDWRGVLDEARPAEDFEHLLEPLGPTADESSEFADAPDAPDALADGPDGPTTPEGSTAPKFVPTPPEGVVCG
ncbi:MAG: LCP family protein [Acidimicrobiia bacterium]|nr:LCP family protein [Acidimicrobiia bacterium]